MDKELKQNYSSNNNHNHNHNHNHNEGDANFNKKQFWSYKRLHSQRNKQTHKQSTTQSTPTQSTPTQSTSTQSTPTQSTPTQSTPTPSTQSTSTQSTPTQSTIDKTKKKQKVFHLVNNKIATDTDLVSRLDSIYIPPNYKDLVVAKSANNKIQAIGTDNRGRRQYIYNRKYTKKRNDRKYDFILGLGRNIIQIEKDNELALKILSSKKYVNWSIPNDYIPIIIYMLKTYHFRIGNEKYTNDNNSYGITTLKKEHIILPSKGQKFTIEFIGKKGILNSFSDDNKLLINIFKTLIQNASSDGYLFKYTHEGVKHFITPDIIHSFFQNKYKEEITPKMFRTWYGNLHMISYLRTLYNKQNANEKSILESNNNNNNNNNNNIILKPRMSKTEINKLVLKCSEHVSSKLNNTPTVSKQSYIDNKILDLVIKNPYRFASTIPNTISEQHKFLYNIILKLRQ